MSPATHPFILGAAHIQRFIPVARSRLYLDVVSWRHPRLAVIFSISALLSVILYPQFFKRSIRIGSLKWDRLVMVHDVDLTCTWQWSCREKCACGARKIIQVSFAMQHIGKSAFNVIVDQVGGFRSFPGTELAVLVMHARLMSYRALPVRSTEGGQSQTGEHFEDLTMTKSDSYFTGVALKTYKKFSGSAHFSISLWRPGPKHCHPVTIRRWRIGT